MKRGFPFGVSILTLVMAIIVPLAVGLLALGWRAASALERDNVDLRMTALETAVTEWLTGGLSMIVAVGETLRGDPDFAFDPSRKSADADRQAQLAGVVDRNPILAAAYVGYQDGRFLYAGRFTARDAALRPELAAPEGDNLLIRRIDGEGAARREAWWFVRADGGRGAERDRPFDYDPRTRPWYKLATGAEASVVTEPYPFVPSNVMGITVAVAIPGWGGALGFDLTLDAMSRVLSTYKISPNSVVVLATGGNKIVAESEPCLAADPACRPDDAGLRRIVRREIGEAAARNAARFAREVEIDGQAHILMFAPIPPILGQSFVTAAAVPLAEISAASRTLLLHSALGGAAAIALAIGAATLVSLLLARSIAAITTKTERIRDLDFSDRTEIRSRINELRRLSGAVERMREGLEIFGRYVSKDLVRQIMSAPESTGVGGVRRDLTVMFTDIEGFSQVSERLAPELLTERLSRYFETVGRPISANRGTIDKYIGDAIMAFWNAPVPDADHVANACRAALEAAREGRLLADKWRALDRPGFRTRFGLHTGQAVIGNIGASDRMNYTLVGVIANQASRLEGLNKVYGTEILGSGEVALATSGLFVWRHVDLVVPAGTTERLDLHELVGERPAGDRADFLGRWDQAKAAYAEGRFDEATSLFERAAKLRPEDGPCRVYIERCRGFARNGVPAGWDGAWYFDRK